MTFHFDQHDSAEHQCDTGQHLVGDTEQRPQGVDATQRIDHALIQQPAPHRHTTGGGDQVGGPGFGAFQRRNERPQQVLQHETTGTGTGVHSSQDKQRFEQNREVVPERHGVFTRQHTVQDLRDTDREGRRTAGTGQDGGFTDVMGNRLQRFRGNRKTPAADRCSHRHHVTADYCSRTVHGEVHARLDHRSGDHGHDCHEGLHQHAAVADVTGVDLVIQQLRRGAGGNQRMETRYRATGNGDEQEREQTALPHRTGAVDELSQCWHFQLGHGDQNTDRQGNDGADFQEGRQVVTRRQDQPHRQYRRDETVTDQHPGDLDTGEAERLGPHRISSNLPTEPDRTEQQQHADHRDLTDAARADVAHVDAHEHRDRDGRHHRENPPRALGQGFHHDQRQHREDDDHDQEAAEQRDGAGDAAHFFANHVTQGATVAAGGHEQDHEILNGTRQHHTGDQPERAGQIPHLRRQHRTDQRPRAGDGREVVTEEDVFVGRHVVQTIVVEYGGGGPSRVKLHHIVSDEQTVVTVRNQINGHGCDHNP
ncbi:hypothetical protein D3C71_523500 [compost metagenome]